MHTSKAGGGALDVLEAQGCPAPGDRTVNAVASATTPTSYGISPIADAATLLNIKLPTMRDLRYHSEDRHNKKGQLVDGNGFSRAFLTLGRKVYVDVDVFIEIWRSKAQGSGG